MTHLLKTILLLAILLHLSCEQREIIWPLNNKPSDLIVVEAVLTNEKIRHQIKLSNPYLSQNLESKPVSSASVYIITNELIPNQYWATETPAGSGLYLTDSLRAVSGIIYTLVINYNGIEYRASDTQAFIEPIPTLDYKAVTDSTYTLKFNSSGNSPCYTKYNLDWSTSGECTNLTSCVALQIYYDLKNIDINELAKPAQEQVNFPLGTVITRKKYSVSEEYKAYLRGMLSETAWRGGLFDVYQANPPTNLSDGAIGFFAVSSVLTDITIIN